MRMEIHVQENCSCNINIIPTREVTQDTSELAHNEDRELNAEENLLLQYQVSTTHNVVEVKEDTLYVQDNSSYQANTTHKKATEEYQLDVQDNPSYQANTTHKKATEEDQLDVQDNPSYQANTTHKKATEEDQLDVQDNPSYQANTIHKETIEENTLENPSYQVSRAHNVTTEEDTLRVQENASYQVTRACNARAEDGNTEYAEVTSSENRNMNINTNIAYNSNSAIQPYNVADDYQYVAVIEDSTQQNRANNIQPKNDSTHENTDPLYEEIFNQEKIKPLTPEQTKTMSTASRAKTIIRSYWQGRVEVYTRIATIVVS